ncbi:50S ribosomal protein L24 [Mycoplasma zalophidermidis]|uniref:Large ribosomal subunit protein uL24 n=1 Tax=Mycoplasma zalophidermidis TaxID=398174 RepID=A0ABS6DS27_9MOLU|nr:50S ribosomal protein L24 [Mycoplasma zalophidermidis]MBU4689817.1 50S ribosomal protein L24 [Mycoplasma zalophidermidis]MBU4693601.1 50S ribosomal protein L24 [Mycoplasma zalophidermidis]MCR8966686.1 50S ribosomal protein L24 [Mycoplasma zalophidermidis]
MKFKVNDEVVVISGAHKWAQGRIIRIDSKNNQVFIKDVNMQIKHKKPSQASDGAIKKQEGPIHVSNIAVIAKKGTKTTAPTISRIGYQIDKNGQKTRIIKKTNKEY